MKLQFLVLIVGLIYLASSITVKERYFETSKTLVYYGYWGSWGSWQTCRDGGYAVSFAQRVERAQGGDDDTALNGICLQCSNGGEVCSSYGGWGSWAHSNKCYPGFKGANFKVEGKQGGGDDTAANGLMLVCQTGGGYRTSNEGGWGSWQGSKYCASGQHVCGIQTRVEAAQGGDDDEDDTALNGVDLRCCGKIASVKVQLVEIFSRPADGNPDSQGAKYTKQIQSTSGLVSSSGYYHTSTAYDVATRVQQVSDYTTAAGAIATDDNSNLTSLPEIDYFKALVKEVLSSALDNRHGSSSVTLAVPVNVYVGVYAYVGQTTVAMSDGSVVQFKGDKMMKSPRKLDISNFTVL